MLVICAWNFILTVSRLVLIDLFYFLPFMPSSMRVMNSCVNSAQNYRSH